MPTEIVKGQEYYFSSDEDEPPTKKKKETFIKYFLYATTIDSKFNELELGEPIDKQRQIELFKEFDYNQNCYDAQGALCENMVNEFDPSKKCFKLSKNQGILSVVYDDKTVAMMKITLNKKWLEKNDIYIDVLCGNKSNAGAGLFAYTRLYDKLPKGRLIWLEALPTAVKVYEKWGMKQTEYVAEGTTNPYMTAEVGTDEPEEVQVMAPRKPSAGKGIAADTLNKLLVGSYTGDEVDGFVLDQELSRDTARVYRDQKTGYAVVAHRGTDGASDWANNAVFGALGRKGYRYTPRYKTSNDVQKAAEQKYGNSNVVTVGHSQGGLLAEMVGGNSREIITLNKATRPQQALVGKKPKKQQYDVRSTGDYISYWDPYSFKKEYKHPHSDITGSKGALTEHSIGVLDRLDNDVVGSSDFVIGSGISTYTKDKAKKLGVKVAISKQPKKKIDVILDGEVVASIGAKGYKDYPTHLKEKGEKYANERRALYKKRHEGFRHKKGTPSYYADQLLW